MSKSLLLPSLCLPALNLAEPFTSHFETIQRLGIKSVDFPLGTDLDDVKQAMEKHGLSLAAQFFPARNWRAPEEEFTDWLKGPARRLVEDTLSLGCRRFGIWMQPGSNELSYAENFKWHAGRLQRLCQLLENSGSTLSIEYVGPRTAREVFRHSFIWNLQQTLELCDVVGENASLLLDSWHWHASLGTAGEIANIPAKRIGLVHINDAPAGIPVEQLIDTRRRLPVATGIIDIGSFLDAIRSTGFSGPVIPEPFDESLKNMPSGEVLALAAQSVTAALEAKPLPALPDTMRVLSVGQRRVREVTGPVPRPAGNEVVVKIHSALICGSNLGQFFGEQEKINGGHEGAGEVVAVAHAIRLKVGDRVALAPTNACGRCLHCRRGDVIMCDHRPRFEGNFAEYTRISEAACILLPPDIDYDTGSLLGCALGPAYGALQAIGARAFDRILVTGLGPVGLGVTALATFLNVEVAVVDPEPYRRDIAAKLGAQLVLDSSLDNHAAALLEFFGPSGVLKGIECTGRPEVQRQMVDLAGKCAHLALIGENHQTLEIRPSNDFLRKGLTVQGIWHMNMNEVDDLISFLRRAPEKARLLLTHRYPMERAQEAFDMFVSRQAVKVAIHP